MKIKRLLLSMVFTLLLGVIYGYSTDLNAAKAAAVPQIFDAILPEDFSLGLFGVFDDAQTVAAVVDITVSSPFFNLTSSSNGDTISGIEQDSTGTYVYALSAEDDSGSGSFDLKITKLDGLGALQAGWPVTVSAGGGIGGFHGQNGFLDLVADGSGGIFVLYVNGAESGFGVIEAFLTHYNGAGTLSAGFPVNLGEYNSDMVTDGSGGVFVLSEIGYDRDAFLALAHGRVQHYTTAGLDAAWAGGSGEFTVSSDVITTKSQASVVYDKVGGGFVYWHDDDAGLPGVYGTRFTSAGLLSTGWTARGKRLHVGATTDGYIRGDTSNADHHYLVFNDASDVTVLSIDDEGDPAWACVQTLSSTDDYDIVASSDLVNPGVFILFDEEAQHFEETTGNSTWSIGGEQVVSGSDTDVRYPSQGYVFENKATSSQPDGSNGVNVVYSNSDSGDQTPIIANFSRSTFALGAGGDCSAVIAPDAPVITGIAGNTEIQIDFPEPADNGSTITQYEIRHGAKAGFPGNEVTIIVPYVAGAVSHTITGLTNGTEYSIRVFATNAGGLSSASNVVDVTPSSVGGRRRHPSEIGKAAAVYLGNKYSAVEEAQSKFMALFHGAASYGDAFGFGDTLGLSSRDLSEVVYQSATGGEENRKFSDDISLLERIGEEKQDILTLLDLIVQLRKLYSWMQHEDYQIFRPYEVAGDIKHDFFLKRFFHQLVGVEYLRRGSVKAYDFDYRDPIHEPTRIVVDYEKSLMLTFGRSCFDESVLSYAEALDYEESPNWFARYREFMEPFTNELLGHSGYVAWHEVDESVEDVLKSIYMYLFGFCLSDAL